MVTLIYLSECTAGTEFYFSTDFFGYSEPVPAVDMIDFDWDGPFHGGKVALTHNKVEFGIVKDRWEFGLLTRYDYELEFSRDTAELYYLVDNELDLQEGREYDLHIKARHTYGDGFRLGYRYSFSNDFALTVGMALLRGQRLLDGELKGDAMALTKNDYEYLFDVDYYYSKDYIFDRDVENAPNGYGHAADLYLSWRRRQYSLQLQIMDIYARLYWDKAPFTVATGSSDRKNVDENGYASFDPVFSGVEGNRNFTQKIPPRVSFSGQYQWFSALALLGRIDYTKAKTFGWLGFGLGSSDKQWQFLYEPEIQASSLGFSASNWSLRLTADSTNDKRVRTVGLSLSYGPPLLR